MAAPPMRLDIDIRRTLVAGPRRFALQVRLASEARRTLLHGPSGAGKSLTLQAIAGLLRPEAGHVRVDGETLFDAAQGIDLPARARRLGYLFQDYALFPHLDVRQNIAFGLPGRSSWRNPSRQVRDPRVEHLLQAFELDLVAHQRPTELSGGQRQRTALARALAPAPRALLLDEPFAALDPALRERLRAELDALLDRVDVPVLMISHDPQDAARPGVRAFGLREGVVVEGAAGGEGGDV